MGELANPAGVGLCDQHAGLVHQIAQRHTDKDH